MKFSARSYSPSPVRGKHRSSSTFGIQSDSESEEYDSELDSCSTSEDDDDSVSTVSGSSSSSHKSLFVTSALNNLSIRRPNHASRSPLEVKRIEETVAVIRSHARYHDPYEEWEKQTRRDAFKTARKELSEILIKHNDEHQRLEETMTQQLKEIYSRQVSEVDKVLALHRQRQHLEDTKLKEAWKAKERQLWQGIEAVIKLEEDKVAKKLEEERKKKEEEDRKRQEEERKLKEEELKNRLAEEKRLQEEAAKKKAEEEKRKQEEERARHQKEEDEKRKRLAEENKRRLAEEAELRRMLVFNPADDDWRVARENLGRLKAGSMRFVKGDKALKSEWSKLRRQIVPKIGQLTNDALAISQITQQIVEIARPSGNPHRHNTIYIALLSSLAKSILLQAETEVTAEKRSAIPLAHVTFNLLETLEHFPSIFFAKLVQRCGGWPIPFVVPQVDLDAKPWPSQDVYRKVCGFRKSDSGEGIESSLEYSNRVSSIMRVYFNILKIRPRQPLDPMFQLSRYWTWFARMVGDPKLLSEPIAPQLIYTALDVMGLEAGEVWGRQWMKVLALVHEGITNGYDTDKLIGGDTAEGSAARTRVMVSLENIVDGVRPS